MIKAFAKILSTKFYGEITKLTKILNCMVIVCVCVFVSILLHACVLYCAVCACMHVCCAVLYACVQVCVVGIVKEHSLSDSHFQELA